jgi:hypothetical protein
VLRQAVFDARATHVSICGSGRDAEFLRNLAVATLGADRIQPNGLILHPANKTTILLGGAPPAELAGAASLPAEIEQIAALCGGPAALDRALALLYDERAGWLVALSSVPESARPLLKHALEAARFRRSRVGLVPKLGSRTLGTDLYA